MSEPKVIVGVDEVGRGALAGPLIVAAVAFRREESPVSATYRGVRGDKLVHVGDSKSFSNETHRVVLDQAIRGVALSVAVVERTSAEIDARLMFTVLPETVGLAISRCIEQLVHRGDVGTPGDFLVLVDGEIPLPPLPCPSRSIIDGDKRSWQIGAASIVAKVARDARMEELHAKFPDWEFDKHKGYPTKQHKALLKKLDITPVHRRTYRPVAEAKGLPPGFEI